MEKRQQPEDRLDAIVRKALMNGQKVSIGLLLLAAIYFAVLFARGLKGGTGLTSMTDFGFYLLFPVVVEVVLITVLLYNPRYRTRCALFLVSVALPLFVGEIVLELTAPTKEGEHVDQFVKNQRAAQTLGVVFDARSKFEVITQLRDEGILAYPIIGPLIRHPLIVNRSEVLPLAGISHATTVVDNEGGEYLIIKSDEHGFNNPEGFQKLKQVDIAIVGDSFGFGYCVRPGQDAVSLLRSAYPRTVNFSICGHGPLCELATIREFVEPVRPRVLLWFYYEGNDLDDLELEKQDVLLMKYLLDRSAWQGLAKLQREIDEQLVIYAERKMRKMREEMENQVVLPGPAWTIFPDIARNCFNRIRLSRLRGRLHDLAAKYRRKHDYDLELFRKILASARDQAYRHGVFYFVYLPSWSRFYEKVLPDPEAERERVLSLVGDLGIPIIDIARLFEQNQDPLGLFPFRLANHYNELGYRIVAEALIQRIRSDLGQSLLCDRQE